MPSEDVEITALWSSGSVLTDDVENEISVNIASKNTGEGSSIIISPGGALSADRIYNKQEGGVGNIVLRSEGPYDVPGSLIHNNTGVEATVERYIGRHGGGGPESLWHMIASPVHNMDVRPEFVPEGIIPPWIDFYKWDESHTATYNGEEITGWWINSKQAGGNWNSDFENAFRKGKGYLLAYGEPDKGHGNKAHSFTGTLHAEPFTVQNLTHSPEGEYAGWHLLGNPFASAIDWTLGDWQRQNILGGPKIWDSQWSSYTPVIDIIPAMTGFMVNTSGNGALTIPPEARVHQATEEPPAHHAGPYDHHADNPVARDIHTRLPASHNTSPRILLRAHETHGHTAQTTIILFRDDATEGFDPPLDTPFMAGHAPKLWSSPPAHDTNPEAIPRLALNNLPEPHDELTIPLGFEKNDSHTFHIKLLQNSTQQALFLEDVFRRKMHALCRERSYHFTAADHDPPGRFFLHLTNGNPPIPSWENEQNPKPHIYATPQKLVAHTWCKKSTLEILNLRGQRVTKTPLNDQGRHTLNHTLNPGVYIARLQCPKSYHTLKLLVP